MNAARHRALEGNLVLEVKCLQFTICSVIFQSNRVCAMHAALQSFAVSTHKHVHEPGLMASNIYAKNGVWYAAHLEGAEDVSAYARVLSRPNH